MKINKSNLTKEQCDRVVKQTVYFRHGVEACKKKMISLINKLSKQYDKSIDIDHLKQEIKDLEVRIINTNR